MIRQTALRMTFAGLALLGASAAQAAEPALELAAVRFETGGSDASVRPHVAPPGQAVLTEIVSWLSEHYDLPAVAEHPRIEFVQPRALAAMRYKSLLREARQGSNAEATAPGTYQREVVALYDDATRTIFLPETWTGKTPAELSILVHEMVHHLQNLGGLKYECPAAREKPAYRAQDRWLGLHGLDLEQEFELDRFTIFVSSACLG